MYIIIVQTWGIIKSRNILRHHVCLRMNVFLSAWMNLVWSQDISWSQDIRLLTRRDWFWRRICLFARLEAIKIFMPYVVHANFKLYQMNVEIVFENSEVNGKKRYMFDNFIVSKIQIFQNLYTYYTKHFMIWNNSNSLVRHRITFLLENYFTKNTSKTFFFI